MTQRILLVDDDPRNLELLQVYLEPLGCTTVQATGGHEARELFDAHGADLVLLDVMMPEVDGFAVLHHIRVTRASPHVPVVLLTAAPEREARLQGVQLGADDFLEKPVDRAILLARVKTLLRLKTMTDELAERNAALERLRVQQRDLTHLLVHDLKSPLTVIGVNLSWAKEEAISPDIAEALTEAAHAARRIQEMVNDMLAVARLEEAGLSIRRTKVSISDMTEKIMRGRAREAAEKKLSLSTEAPLDVVVDADAGLLERILENLVDNAFRYTPRAGEVSMVARRVDTHGTHGHGENGSHSGDSAAGETIEIAVSNTGRPIPEPLRESLFEKFTTSGARINHGNVGMGLYFCRLAAEAHGGDIRVESSEEWPTSFVLRLPAAGDAA